MSRQAHETNEQYLERTSAEARCRGLAKRREMVFGRAKQSCGDWNWRPETSYFVNDCYNNCVYWLTDLKTAENYLRSRPLFKYN